MTTQLNLVGKVLAASREGRDVLFLTGAGLSVASGIPSLAGLTEYLAKVHCYITQGAFSPLPLLAEELRKDPSHYLRDFGWPDPHQLHAELWRWIEEKGGRDREDYRRLLELHIRAEYLSDLARQDQGIQKKGAEALKKRDEGGACFDATAFQKGGPLDLELQGNWKTLLAHLTQANQDYVDTLFQRLTKDRLPGMAHRLLASLTPFLGVRLFLTVNFDELLETALRDEGLEPAVYAVSRDSPLPHPSLVRDELSVIKLHGSSFGLRVGEDLDHPLDEDSKKRLVAYLPEHAVLIVIGLGGSDRRIMDFVKLVAERPGTETFWLHFEKSCPPQVAELRARLAAKPRAGVITAIRTCEPAGFLLELCYRFAGAHPPSSRGYVPQMLRLVAAAEEAQGELDPAERTPEKPIKLFSAHPKCFGLGATLQIAQFIALKSRSHTPIWIDLESMYTYEEASAEVIRLIRQQDRSVAPLGLPAGDSSAESSRKARRRIFDALLRGKYILALDGVGAFGRPPTEHHSHELPEREQSFLRDLIDEAVSGRKGIGPLRDSLLVMSTGPVGKDHPQIPTLYEKIRNNQDLKPLVEFPVPVPGYEPSPPPEKLGNDLVPLLVIASFRRRRSYVALLRILPDYLPENWRRYGTPEEQVHTFLELYEQNRYIRRAEGGDYWMGRRLRDRVYDLAARATGPERLRKLALLASIHQDIACYYADLLAASQDSFAFLEQIYHRVASLRYLTQLDMRLRAPSDVSEAERAATGQSLRLANISFNNLQQRIPELRLEQLRTLCRIFEREREALLSRISSDTLIGWIQYIETRDVSRFKRNYPDGASDDPRIEVQCAALKRILADLKGDAQRDKMNYRACIRVRKQQIRRLFKSSRSVLTDEGRDALRKSAKDEKDWTKLHDLLRDLGDVWRCLLCIGSKRADPMHQTMEMIYTSAVGPAESLALIKTRWLRHEADHLLRRSSPWDWTHDPDRRQKVERAIAICSEALAMIEWAAGARTYPRYKSYFHSLRGKALYLCGEFDAALRALNLAASGVPATIGANRETLAVGLLRLAECVMVRARVGIDRGEDGTDLPRALLRARRRLNRAESELAKAEALLFDARQNMEWWACLYQLLAQLQVERLLLLLNGSRSCSRSEIGPLEDVSFLAQLTHGVQLGLSAISQGLDVLLPVTPVRGTTSQDESFRIRRFLRIWIELMTCSLTLRRLIKYETDKTAPLLLWSRWEQLNESMGLGDLIEAGGKKEEIRDFFLGVDESYRKENLPPETTGLEARSYALGLMQKCIQQKQGVERLFEAVYSAPSRAPQTGKAQAGRPPLHRGGGTRGSRPRAQR